MSVFEVDVVQTTGTWEFLIDQGVWELEVVTGPRGPIYVAGEPISHAVLTDRSNADQHPSDAITVAEGTMPVVESVDPPADDKLTTLLASTDATIAAVGWNAAAIAVDLATTQGDVAALQTDVTTLQAHTGATDPHGDRAYAAALVDDLSGVSNASTARTNLGLGTLATASTIASADITDGTIVAGDLATALSNRIPTVATAGSDTSVTSSTTLTNDTGLVFAIPTTGTWHYRAVLWVTGDSAGDLDTAVTTPANTAYFAMTRGVSNAASSQPGTPNDVTVTSSGTRMTGFGTLTAGATMVTIEGTVVATATGNIQVQHSQRNSNATATIVKAGSSLSVWGG